MTGSPEPLSVSDLKSKQKPPSPVLLHRSACPLCICVSLCDMQSAISAWSSRAFPRMGSLDAPSTLATAHSTVTTIPARQVLTVAKARWRCRLSLRTPPPMHGRHTGIQSCLWPFSSQQIRSVSVSPSPSLLPSLFQQTSISVFSPSVCLIPSIKVLADLNEGSPHGALSFHRGASFKSLTCGWWLVVWCKKVLVNGWGPCCDTVQTLP